MNELNKMKTYLSVGLCFNSCQDLLHLILEEQIIFGFCLNY